MCISLIYFRAALILSKFSPIQFVPPQCWGSQIAGLFRLRLLFEGLDWPLPIWCHVRRNCLRGRFWENFRRHVWYIDSFVTSSAYHLILSTLSFIVRLILNEPCAVLAFMMRETVISSFINIAVPYSYFCSEQWNTFPSWALILAGLKL